MAMVHEIEGDGEGEDAEEQEEVIVSSELDGQQKAVDEEANRLQRPEVRDSEREVKREERRGGGGGLTSTLIRIVETRRAMQRR